MRMEESERDVRRGEEEDLIKSVKRSEERRVGTEC